jgi:hypothetical protein
MEHNNNNSNNNNNNNNSNNDNDNNDNNNIIDTDSCSLLCSSPCEHPRPVPDLPSPSSPLSVPASYAGSDCFSSCSADFQRTVVSHSLLNTHMKNNLNAMRQMKNVMNHAINNTMQQNTTQSTMTMKQKLSTNLHTNEHQISTNNYRPQLNIQFSPSNNYPRTHISSSNSSNFPVSFSRSLARSRCVTIRSPRTPSQLEENLLVELPVDFDEFEHLITAAMIARTAPSPSTAAYLAKREAMKIAAFNPNQISTPYEPTNSNSNSNPVRLFVNRRNSHVEVNSGTYHMLQDGDVIDVMVENNIGTVTPIPATNIRRANVSLSNEQQQQQVASK